MIKSPVSAIYLFLCTHPVTYSPHNVSFSHYYLDNLNSDIFDLVRKSTMILYDLILQKGVSSYDIGKNKIHDGDA